MAQGKAFEKDKILESLKQYFLLGYNRAKACMFVGFDASLLTKWEKAEPELSIKIDGWINYVNSKARENVAKAIIEEKNKDDAKWWLEKREKDEFGKAIALDQTIKDDTKTQEALDKLNNFLNGQQTPSNSADEPGNVQNPAIRGTSPDNPGNS